MIVQRKRAVLLRHYGSDEFKSILFQPINDASSYNGKPGGGLWTTPARSTGWCDYIRESSPGCSHLLSISFDVSFKGKLLVVNSRRDMLKHFHWEDHVFGVRPIYEPLLNQGIDAIHLTARGLRATHAFSEDGRDLHYWDVESVLILNPDSIMPLPNMLICTRKRKPVYA